jgi:hypothetical protein
VKFAKIYSFGAVASWEIPVSQISIQPSFPDDSAWRANGAGTRGRIAWNAQLLDTNLQQNPELIGLTACLPHFSLFIP